MSNVTVILKVAFLLVFLSSCRILTPKETLEVKSILNQPPSIDLARGELEDGRTLYAPGSFQKVFLGIGENNLGPYPKAIHFKGINETRLKRLQDVYLRNASWTKQIYGIANHVDAKTKHAKDYKPDSYNCWHFADALVNDIESIPDYGIPPNVPGELRSAWHVRAEGACICKKEDKKTGQILEYKCSHSTVAVRIRDSNGNWNFALLEPQSARATERNEVPLGQQKATTGPLPRDFVLCTWKQPDGQGVPSIPLSCLNVACGGFYNFQNPVLSTPSIVKE